MSMVGDSDIIGIFQRALKGRGGRQLGCYGDLGHRQLGGVLWCGFKADQGDLTEAQILFNSEMSTTRIAVEWAFGDITAYTLYFPSRFSLPSLH